MELLKSLPTLLPHLRFHASNLFLTGILHTIVLILTPQSHQTPFIYVFRRAIGSVLTWSGSPSKSGPGTTPISRCLIINRTVAARVRAEKACSDEGPCKAFRARAVLQTYRPPLFAMGSE